MTNLVRYRRHLPNYVLDLEEEEEEEGEEDPIDDGTTPSASGQMSVVDRTAPANASASETPIQPVVVQAPDQSEESSANEVIPFSLDVLNAGPEPILKRRRVSPVLNITGLVAEGLVTFSMVV